MSAKITTARALVSDLSNGTLEFQNVLATITARRADLNPRINAFDSIVERPAVPGQGPLHGLPITVKDQIAVKDQPLRFGLDRASDKPAEYTAPVVERLVDAGAVVVGKTTLPPYAMDFQTSNARLGRTNNPWDLERTCGGSSGGGAAAVASGMSLIDMGADLSGSLRLPAAFCGICSLLPGEGQVPNDGMLQGRARLAHFARPGPMARNIDDLRLIWEVLSGETASASDDKPSLAIWTAGEKGPATDQDIANRFADVRRDSLANGAQVKGDPLEMLFEPEIYQVFGHIMGHETGGLMPWPIRMLARVTGRGAAARSPRFLAHIHEGYRRDRRRYERACAARDTILETWTKQMEAFDAVLLPVCPVAPFAHLPPDSDRGGIRDYHTGFKAVGEEVGYFDTLTTFTAPVTLLGLPVVTLPLGLDRQGLPIGGQLVGKAGGEHRLLDIAATISRLYDMPRPPVSAF
ncbi:amidase [Thalassococcus sp. S3]|uniref:amidase n=1 Tax=Thalassococcus sp. S3 TaxID=2017482 RepID=UPI0013EEC1F6|nr:amidase [Thalassococcus sp. S3]